VAWRWPATLQSPETYVGYRQSTGFAQDDVARFDQPRVYTPPLRLPLNTWGLTGTWTVTGDAGVLNEPGGRIAFQFHARDLNLVMGPPSQEASVPFRVVLDGDVAQDARGSDVDPDASGTVRGQRTYQLIRQPGPIADRLFEVEFQEAGVEAYCFTFG
jgi:hypothetical protein